MAIPRKGSRLITVEGRDYRWTVSPDDEPGVAMVVELRDRPRQRLVSWVEHGVVITPAIVREAIGIGVAAGWSGEDGGADHVQRLYGRWEPTFALKQ